MTGILLFIVLPLVALIVVGVCVALFASGGKRTPEEHRGIGNNFIDWML